MIFYFSNETHNISVKDNILICVTLIVSQYFLSKVSIGLCSIIDDTHCIVRIFLWEIIFHLFIVDLFQQLKAILYVKYSVAITEPFCVPLLNDTIFTYFATKKILRQVWGLTHPFTSISAKTALKKFWIWYLQSLSFQYHLYPQQNSFINYEAWYTKNVRLPHIRHKTKTTALSYSFRHWRTSLRIFQTDVCTIVL